MDLTKDFDNVNHNKLFGKLKLLGVRRVALKIIKVY